VYVFDIVPAIVDWIGLGQQKVTNVYNVSPEKNGRRCNQPSDRDRGQNRRDETRRSAIVSVRHTVVLVSYDDVTDLFSDVTLDVLENRRCTSSAGDGNALFWNLVPIRDKSSEFSTTSFVPKFSYTCEQIKKLLLMTCIGHQRWVSVDAHTSQQIRVHNQTLKLTITLYLAVYLYGKAIRLLTPVQAFQVIETVFSTNWTGCDLFEWKLVKSDFSGTRPQGQRQGQVLEIGPYGVLKDKDQHPCQ